MGGFFCEEGGKAFVIGGKVGYLVVKVVVLNGKRCVFLLERNPSIKFLTMSQCKFRLLLLEVSIIRFIAHVITFSLLESVL